MGSSPLPSWMTTNSNYPTNGGYRRVTVVNPASTANGGGTNIVNTQGNWSISYSGEIQPGTYTIEVRCYYVVGSSAKVSGNSSTTRQGDLKVTTITY